jgi:type II secretory pathway pseudopilin PulG
MVDYIRVAKAFTLVELLITLLVFIGVMALVLAAITGLLRSWRQGQAMILTQQKERACLAQLSKEIASVTRVAELGNSLAGTDNQIFFVYARPDCLAEARYSYNSASHSLERYIEMPADYNPDTWQVKQVCLRELSSCEFSYSDGDAWKSTWSASDGRLPRGVKITFDPAGQGEPDEFVVNVGVGS